MANLVKSLANVVNRYDAQRRAADKSAPVSQTVAPAAPEPATSVVLHPEILGTIGEEIAHNLGQNDRSVRDDSSRMRDLIDVRFEGSSGLFVVKLILPEGRPREHEYGRGEHAVAREDLQMFR